MLARLWRTTVAGSGLEVAAATAQGPRAENQDNLLVLLPSAAGGGRAWALADGDMAEAEVTGWPAHAVRVAVLDGMGGHNDGRLASETLTGWLRSLPFQSDPAALRAAVLALHARLRALLPGPDERRGGSTLFLIDLDLRSGQAVRLHVGDSRGYLWHRRKWHGLGHDQRASEFARRDGESSSADDQPGGPLAQAMGFGSVTAFARAESAVNPGLRLDLAEDLADGAVDHADVARLRLEPGDRLLLVTDGALGDDEGLGLLTALAGAAAQALVVGLSAAAATASDNLTGVLLALDAGAAATL